MEAVSISAVKISVLAAESAAKTSSASGFSAEASVSASVEDISENIPENIVHISVHAAVFKMIFPVGSAVSIKSESAEALAESAALVISGVSAVGVSSSRSVKCREAKLIV